MQKKLILSAIVYCLISGASAQYPANKIKSFYQARQAEFKLTSQDLDHFIITDSYTSRHNGVTHVYLRQVVNGIEIFNANSSLHINQQGGLISINNAFVPDAASKINMQVPLIGGSVAMLSAGNHIGMNLTPVMSKADMPLSGNKLELMDQTVSPEPVKLKLYYLNTDNGLKLAYNVEVFDQSTSDWWNVRIDAGNGSVLEKNNWTTHCNVSSETYANESTDQFATFLSANAPDGVRPGKTGSNVYNVFPFHVESPNFGQRKMISNPATANASPYGWHDTNGVAGAEYTITRGNNVFAKEDTLAANGNGYSPDGEANLVFDFPMDTSWMDPSSYVDAAITNVFYCNNVVHDVFYQYGFNEEAGNFQVNNYGKGGLEGDAIQADAQDGSGTRNANFSAPEDGKKGRMQMFLWPVSTAANPKLTVEMPVSISGQYTAPVSLFGTKRFEPITARVVLVNDGSSNPTYACGAIENNAELAGNIALIDRGGMCNYPQKILNAQQAGAAGAIVIQSNSSPASSMTGSDVAVTIPSVMLSKTDGAKLKTSVINGDIVIATMKGLPAVKAYDSDFDNGVIIHEYGHGISIRLTGGPSNSNCLFNAEQGGEGWSDFFALALTAKITDDPEGGRGMGTFVFNQPPNGLGLRDYKYSRNMSINPMVYKSIRNNAEVHYVGTVWCTILWDIFLDMVDKYGFDEDVYNGNGGNNKAIQLVIDGLKLQKCSPGFIDSRNAILLADSINNGGANRTLLWKAFARRGLGYSSSQGSSNSTTDGTSTFDLPPFIDLTGTTDVNLAGHIGLYPNPASGVATLVLPDQLTSGQLTVTDITGKIIINEQAYTDGNQHIRIDLGAYPDGLYLVRLTSGATVYQSKLLLGR